MKCSVCGNNNETNQIRNINWSYCCNQFTLDFDSLRPQVKKMMMEEDFYQQLRLELSNIYQETDF